MKKIIVILICCVVFAPSIYAHTSRVNRSFRIGNRILNGTPDSLLFIDLNNKIAEDNANLSYDDTNDRLTVGGLLINAAETPTSASATGTLGQLTWDTDYIYVCVSANTWKRTALTTWSTVDAFLLLESDDFILLESGDQLILE